MLGMRSLSAARSGGLFLKVASQSLSNVAGSAGTSFTDELLENSTLEPPRKPADELMIERRGALHKHEALPVPARR
jgi:hypothetical protein